MSRLSRVPIDDQMACARRQADRLSVNGDDDAPIMRAIAATLAFHARYAEAFRRLARDLLAAERSDAAADVRREFPGAKVADIRERDGEDGKES